MSIGLSDLYCQEDFPEGDSFCAADSTDTSKVLAKRRLFADDDDEVPAASPLVEACEELQASLKLRTILNDAYSNHMQQLEELWCIQEEIYKAMPKLGMYQATLTELNLQQRVAQLRIEHYRAEHERVSKDIGRLTSVLGKRTERE